MTHIIIELDNSHRISFYPAALSIHDVKLDITLDGLKHKSHNISMTVPLNSCHSTNGDEPIHEQLFDNKFQKIIASVNGQVWVFTDINMRYYESNIENGYIKIGCQNDGPE